MAHLTEFEPQRVRRVLEQFAVDVAADRDLNYLGGAGGFSGALFWRLPSAAGELCLRRWPAEMQPSRLEFIHRVLQHAWDREFQQLPLPRTTRRGTSYVVDSHLWELTPWMPGRANYHDDPSDKKLAIAMQTLARFHRAVADYDPQPTVACSPGLQQRLELLQKFQATGAAEIAGRLDQWTGWPEVPHRARRILRHFRDRSTDLAAQLQDAAQVVVPLQPCLRDVWHDHVLYEGEQVTSLIDFGALRAEVVTGDLVRLVGSLVADDAGKAAWALDQYKSMRPLSPDERRLLPVFDQSAVVLSAMNWLKWIVVEHRRFEQPAHVLQRIDDLLQRLDGGGATSVWR